MAHAVTPIPAACITTEDADFFSRMAERNISVSNRFHIAQFLYCSIHAALAQIVLSLSMQAQNFPPVPSRNIVAEITGSQVRRAAHLRHPRRRNYAQHPEQIVLFGGHTDSWDVGQGAQDDGAGFMVSYEALYLIKKLGLKPVRTIRLVG
jgi:hypothetical protein